jgi:transcriptional regulator with XRE-family HTH domain
MTTRAKAKPGIAGRRAKAAPASVRIEFGLTQKVFARLSGLSERTLATWERGGAVGEAARRSLAAADRLLTELAIVIRKPALPAWLDTPNPGFGGLKPLEVVERGEADRLWRMIYFLGSGTAS